MGSSASGLKCWWSRGPVVPWTRVELSIPNEASDLQPRGPVVPWTRGPVDPWTRGPGARGLGARGPGAP